MRKLSLSLLLALTSMILSVELRADSPHGKDFKLSCDLCHSANSWKFDRSIYAFDHSKTAFPLAGQHQAADCRQCHSSLVFSEAKTSCTDCHTDMHQQTVGPDCGRCHTPKSWLVENITEIHQRSRFPLVGAHYTADCNQCHPSASLLRYDPRGVECWDCHQQNYTATTSPNHVQGNYSKNCIECHSINSFSWTSLNVDHSFFPLKEGHAVDCNQCHTSGSYSKLPTDCFNCHLPNYNATTNPNHPSGSFPTTCNDCHTLNPGWRPATFAIHDNYYALTGAHTATDCNSCHIGGNYNNTPNVCVGCHQQNFNQTTNPNHASLQFPTTCADCHTTNPGWKPATFDIHSNYYPLTGAHLTTDCNSCHPGGTYTNTPNTCVGCHQANYNQSANPPHTTLNFPTTCADCHTTNPGWRPATFAIHSNYYPLTGAHLTTDCNSCHIGGNYNNTPNTCVGCHQTNYNQTTNPPHATLSFPTTCADCHTTNPGWKPATFAIHSNYYPLTGAHTSVDCNSCHVGGNYNNTPNTCVGCHQTDYNQSTNPPHLSLNFPTSCTDCHTTNPGWQPATFAIHNNYYVLQGAHLNISCNACHNGNYSGNLPTTCIGCHQADYNATTNPPHASAQFPTDCLLCHNQNAWVPANFNHDGQYFPIYSGKHQGEWSLCSDCHTNASNYQVFSCINCHEHNNKQEVDNDHNGVAGYTYTPTSCYDCHPTGNSGGKMPNQRNLINPTNK
jgi:hypothetical protein